jgi:hypothetical protein
MLIPFTFTAEDHVYKTPGRYCLSTGDVIKMNGLSNLDAVPAQVLEAARAKGDALHLAVHALEENDLMGYDGDQLDPEAFPDWLYEDLKIYLKWKEDNDVQVVHPCEKALVYLHEYADQAIGCHIDLRAFVKGKLYILDLKRRHPAAGIAKKQMHLAWRAQSQSYWDATQFDEQFWKQAGPHTLHRAMLHIHPKHAQYRNGHEFVDFGASDDGDLWASLVKVAVTKLAAGYQLERK